MLFAPGPVNMLDGLPICCTGAVELVGPGPVDVSDGLLICCTGAGDCGVCCVASRCSRSAKISNENADPSLNAGDSASLSVFPLTLRLRTSFVFDRCLLRLCDALKVLLLNLGYHNQ